MWLPLDPGEVGVVTKHSGNLLQGRQGERKRVDAWPEKCLFGRRQEILMLRKGRAVGKGTHAWGRGWGWARSQPDPQEWGVRTQGCKVRAGHENSLVIAGGGGVRAKEGGTQGGSLHKL